MIYSNDDFSYDSETGILSHARHKSGQHGGSLECSNWLNQAGYKMVRIKRKRFFQHRVIMWVVNGEWPTLQVDHINGNKQDNRLVNLRLVTHNDQVKNQGIQARNKTGIPGVWWCRTKKRYQVWIGRHYKKWYYKDFFEACCKRKQLENDREYHVNHGRRPSWNAS